MTDPFHDKSSTESLSMPVAETLYASSAGCDWQESGVPGFLMKPLFESGSRRTLLMKAEPGSFSEMHAHEETEELFVLEGSFYDQDRTYGVGDYAIRAPGYMHEAGSKNGAVILLIYW